VAISGDPLAQGRAHVERLPEGLRIVIPAHRGWPALLFVAVWLGIWTVAGANSIGDLLAGRTEDEAFSVVWLGGWTLGLLFGCSMLAWRLLGREEIIVGSRAMTVVRRAGPYRRTLRFTRDRIAHLRTEADARAGRGVGGGSIAFDYGVRTHRFASTLDEAESRHIVELLRRELGVRDQPK
jgi:hypothetical protein